MPFVSLDHVRASLNYMGEHLHPALMSLLAMLRKGVPSTGDPGAAVTFGSADEVRLMEDYFRPAGGPDSRPLYLPFGAGRGAGSGVSHWREVTYPAKSLQRMRSDRPGVFLQRQEDRGKWTLAPDLIAAVNSSPKPTAGSLPIIAAYLAVWVYRDRDLPSIAAAVDDLVAEFRLKENRLVPSVFTDEVPSDLAGPLQDTPIEAGELLKLLQSYEPEKETASESPEDESEAPAPESGPVALVREPPPAPGDWNMQVGDLGDLCGLVGVEEAATRAVAALSAGMHVIFTGAPGSGKTKLAECICKRAGFPAWTVPATDQWTTFETIGGYFPAPTEGSGVDRLDFLPGAVVDSLLHAKCLIIDEINRADIDKAFGELFTLLSGSTVTLPYRRRSGIDKFRRVRLQVGPAVVEDPDADVIAVPNWWRIIGSMNDSDKASLKRLSMAFVRRFAFIPVDLPIPEIYQVLIQDAVARTAAGKAGDPRAADLAKALVTLFATRDEGLGRIGMPLGPAFAQSIVKHIDSEWRVDPGRTPDAVLASAIELYIVPQFQGRPDLHEDAVRLFEEMVPDHAEKVSEHLAVWTGFVPA